MTQNLDYLFVIAAETFESPIKVSAILDRVRHDARGVDSGHGRERECAKVSEDKESTDLNPQRSAMEEERSSEEMACYAEYLERS